MAEIRPFNGVRYDVGIAGAMSELISPPYDIIRPDERERLHQVSPHNFVRLVLGQEIPTDSETDNRFKRAGGFLRDWLTSGALKRDDEPAIYRQRITFSLNGQEKSLTGITALVRIREYEDRVILPHEKTLSGPKEDLAKLMTETKANLDSIWMLYEDNEHQVKDSIEGADWETVIPPVSASAGVSIALDRAVGSDAAAISKAFSGETLTIADGHHRYETALNMSRIHSGENSWQYLMITMAWTDDPGLVVLPTHRVLSGLDESALGKIPELLSQHLDVQHCSGELIEDELAKCPESSFAYFDGSTGFLCQPKDEADILGAELSQNLVLAEGLGFDVTRLKTDPRIRYVEDLNQAVSLASSSDYQAAVLLQPIAVRTITRYSRVLRSMPQKSTYFYPKLASGLVLRLIEEA